MSGIFSTIMSRRRVDDAPICPPEEDIFISPPPPEGEGGTLHLLPTEMIDPNPAQPRRYFDSEALFALADSIRRYGILQPISVTFCGGSGRYTLVAGERRLRAARLAGLDRVPAILMTPEKVRDGELAVLAVIENIQRRDLNMFEEATAIRSMISDFGMTQEAAAEGLSVSQSYIANKLRLLRLTEDECEQILAAGLSERHARALLRLKDETVRRRALSHIISRGMNVARTEEYIEELLSREASPSAPPSRQRTVMAVRDVRLFCNSIDRAVDSIKKAGVAVTTSRRDEADRTEIVISIHRG